ncbi:MAG: hybrid sensor histidine kinase/response regulator [Ramlibacter sp.]
MMFGDFCRRFDAALRQCVSASAGSLAMVACIGAVVYAGYGILWLYVAPVEYESLELRGIGFLLCLSVCASSLWPQRLKPWLPWVVFVTVMYTLPFYATYQLLGSNYSVLRSMLLVTMVFFVIVVFPDYMLALINIAAGMALAVLAGYLMIPEFSELNHAIVKSVHIQALVYTATAGLLFTRSNLKALLARQRVDALKDLAGSIAHELRNPLGQLRHQLETVSKHLPRTLGSRDDLTIRAYDLDIICKELAGGKFAIARGMQMISMTLDEIHERPLDSASWSYISAERATRRAVEEFDFQSGSDRERLELRVDQDFVFKGDETRYLFVVFNLLKNATYYFKDHPHAVVRFHIASGCVTVEDTGPGMKAEVLAHVFESFHTSGKPGGTGLGLSFCKRTMRAFGGDITCESRLGQFTRFTLQFPAVPAQEIDAHEAQVLEQGKSRFAGKRVLVVDDVPGLRKTARAMLQPLGAAIEEAEHGLQALEMLSAGSYAALVLDLSMPVLDGYATAQRIRAGSIPGMARLPIVAYTAEATSVLHETLDRLGVHAIVDKTCSHTELVQALCQAHDHGCRLERADAAAVLLAGKRVLLVDDEELNRRYLRSILEVHHIDILEASSGACALEMLQVLAVDAVITDIHMPVLDGIGLAQALRASALPRKPIVIALSARVEQAAVAQAHKSGIDGFLSKPAEPGELLEMLARTLLPGAAAALGPSVKQLPPARVHSKELLDVRRLESLRRVRMLEELVPESLQAARTLFGRLQDPVARRDAQAARELLHSLVGICGNMGAHALYQEVRAMYVALIEHRQWPGADWHQEILDLHARTEMAIRDHVGEQPFAATVEPAGPGA